jgi:hypothetical protein
MALDRFFADFGLLQEDQVAIANAVQLALASWGTKQCWRLDRISHPVFAGFNTSNQTSLLYKGCSSRILLLGMIGQLGEEGEIAIRRSICTSPHCLNPDHYFWGKRNQVSLKTQKNTGVSMSGEVIQSMRLEHGKGEKIIELSRRYKVPYHTARRICVGETYESLNETEKPKMTPADWSHLKQVCNDIINRYPEKVKDLTVEMKMTKELECPWHRHGDPKHKGNFGSMGECLDCMDEIRNGRCTVDVTNFDFRWYWTVKRFWDYVDIKGEDECWPWIGPIKKDKSESVAYFPSPFHAGKSQSASRVAFWLSRGYTGKYRVFSFNRCVKFCCNPKHLTIRDLRDQPIPDKIKTINLSYGNIFDRQRETLTQSQSGTTD